MESEREGASVPSFFYVKKWNTDNASAISTTEITDQFCRVNPFYPFIPCSFFTSIPLPLIPSIPHEKKVQKYIHKNLDLTNIFLLYLYIIK
jgi:hypothetical protein